MSSFSLTFGGKCQNSSVNQNSSACQNSSVSFSLTNVYETNVEPECNIRHCLLKLHLIRDKCLYEMLYLNILEKQLNLILG